MPWTEGDLFDGLTFCVGHLGSPQYTLHQDSTGKEGWAVHTKAQKVACKVYTLHDILDFLHGSLWLPVTLFTCACGEPIIGVDYVCPQCRSQIRWPHE